MADSIAKVHLSLRDGVLQLEGSEAFVSAQLALLEPHIVRAFKAEVQPEPREPTVRSNPRAAPRLQDFDHLFAEANGKVQILKTLPGTSSAQKTVSAALLLAFAGTLLGKDTVPTDVVRDLCKSHACLDSAHFSEFLKNQKELFLLEGSGRVKEIRLTVPGRKRAEDLARQLNAS